MRNCEEGRKGGEERRQDETKMKMRDLTIIRFDE